MTQQEFLTSLGLDANQQNIEMYKNLVNDINSLGQESIDYFNSQVVPEILKHGLDEWDLLDELTMSYFYVRNGSDIAPFLNNPVSYLQNHANMLADFRDMKVVRDDAAKKVETLLAIDRLADKHVFHKKGISAWEQHGNFYSANDGKSHKMPLQGWKLHISSNDIDDYKKILSCALPEFDKAGVMYKIVNPSQFSKFTNGEQAGKHITIYLTEAFDVSKFSQELRAILNEKATPVNGEMEMGGRIFARYGKFRGNDPSSLVNIEKGKSRDVRGMHAPEWVKPLSPEQVLSYVSDCKARLEQTGDYKAYAQEMFLMHEMVPGNYLYMAVEINPLDIEDVTDAVKYSSNYGSAVYELDGHAYVMIHEQDKENVLSQLQRDDIKYIRPEWDFKCAMHYIDPSQEELAREMIGPDDKDISIAHFNDGTVVVCVDETLKEDSHQFCMRVDFDGYGIQVLDTVHGCDHKFAIDQNQIETKDIDLDDRESEEYDSIDWD